MDGDEEAVDRRGVAARAQSCVVSAHVEPGDGPVDEAEEAVEDGADEGEDWWC